MLLLLPVIVGMMDESISDILMDVLLPFLFSGIVVCGELVTNTFGIMYSLFFVFLLVWIFILGRWYNYFLNVRKKYFSKLSYTTKRNWNFSSRPKFLNFKTNVGFVVYSLKKIGANVFDTLMNNFSSNSIKFRNNETEEKMNAIWLNINLPLNLQCRINNEIEKSCKHSTTFKTKPINSFVEKSNTNFFFEEYDYANIGEEARFSKIENEYEKNSPICNSDYNNEIENSNYENNNDNNNDEVSKDFNFDDVYFCDNRYDNEDLNYYDVNELFKKIIFHDNSFDERNNFFIENTKEILDNI
jgi:hypothetical protein